MRGGKKIANVISTISKHEYNYRGDDKNKVKKIGTQLYVLKKKHKVAIGTTKSCLCSGKTATHSGNDSQKDNRRWSTMRHRHWDSESSTRSCKNTRTQEAEIKL